MSYLNTTQVENTMQDTEQKNALRFITNDEVRQQTVFHNKQRGVTLLEVIMWLVIAAFIALISIGLYNKAMSGGRNMATTSDVSVILSGAAKWGGNNKTGISMTKLCEKGSQYLTNEVCGSSENGTNANQYGGNYAIAVDPTNSSRVKVSITGIDSNYVTVVANDLAPLSYDNCHLADGCATLTKAGTTVTLTR
jgi:Tfp pilus assembly protein PilE